MGLMNHRLWILDRKSRHPDLMERMMQYMRVSPFAAARVDGGMAWSEARTKCIFCQREDECTHWLENPKGSGDPRQFCPNVRFFRQCGADPVYPDMISSLRDNSPVGPGKFRA